MNALAHFGKYLMLIRSFFKSPERLPVYIRQIVFESADIGVGSLLIVVLISTFMGAVTTIQTAYQLTSALIPKSIIGAIVVNTALLELAPTITSLVLAGKVGASISSHLGNMRVTEQIDALEVMGINSASYLIMPKIIASVLMFPLLVIVAAFLQTFGGLVAGHLTGEVVAPDFIQGAREYFEPFQVTFMLIKAVTFGFIISSISSYQGYFVRGGALEVGQASTRSVVFSCIIVLTSDYILAQVLL